MSDPTEIAEVELGPLLPRAELDHLLGALDLPHAAALLAFEQVYFRRLLRRSPSKRKAFEAANLTYEGGRLALQRLGLRDAETPRSQALCGTFAVSDRTVRARVLWADELDGRRRVVVFTAGAALTPEEREKLCRRAGERVQRTAGGRTTMAEHRDVPSLEMATLGGAP